MLIPKYASHSHTADQISHSASLSYYQPYYENKSTMNKWMNDIDNYLIYKISNNTFHLANQLKRQLVDILKEFLKVNSVSY